MTPRDPRIKQIQIEVTRQLNLSTLIIRQLSTYGLEFYWLINSEGIHTEGLFLFAFGFVTIGVFPFSRNDSSRDPIGMDSKGKVGGDG